ncbi:MAG: adenosylcobinamide-phosphate synthase CbiB [Bacillota bacterium]|nr:adenosylcobinamide-phosphate synthase CbiB [Bacillota bacterium]
MINMICMAFVLDLFLGDPHFLYHPVRLMGRIIEIWHPLTERARWKVLAGALYPVSLIALCLVFMWAVRLLPSPVPETVTVYILYTSLATRSLADEVLKVLKVPNLNQRRRALSMLCSRDTDALDERGILSTLFETTSENSVDGVLAPLFYMIVFAPLGFSAEAALIYKAVSTCDSMVGYKNDRFVKIGRISARLDDCLNFIPARVSVIVILLAGALYRRSVHDLKNGIKIYLRDRTKHASPNSAHPMSAFAGIFGVQICGPVPYFGKTVNKPYIGDALVPLNAKIVTDSVRVMILSAFLMLAAGIGIVISL